MRFTVQMVAFRGHATQLQITAVGLDALDRCRKELDLPELDPDIVRQYVDSMDMDSKKIEITEEMARKAGHYREESVIVVEVPAGFLNGMVDMEIVVERDRGTDEIWKISLKRVLSNVRVLMAWEAAGYPLKWGFEDQEDQEDQEDTER